MNTIKIKKLYPVGQCCIKNGVPNNCLGLCQEEHYASLYQFPDVCVQYQDIIDDCTILSAGKYHMDQN